MSQYRKIWEHYHGIIPVDENGRTYEIHHIDGNRENNDINNLLCISIKEHYDIHYKQGDYGACVMIAKRMELPTDYLSEIQKGKKRPGIGGVKKGTVPWNKGITGYKLNLSEDARWRMGSGGRNSKVFNDDNIKKILELYDNRIEIFDDRIGKIQRNGKMFTYKRAFCEKIAKDYCVTTQSVISLMKKHVQEE